MISTVLFDIGETYLTGLKGFEFQLEPILKISPEKIHEGFHGRDLRDLFNGNINEEQYWEKIIKKNGWNLDVKYLIKSIRNNFKEIEGVRVIIERLKKKKYKIGLISNHAKEWIEYCEEKFDYHKHFDYVGYSFSTKFPKPEKEAFLLALKSLKSKPEECVFIDDLEKNLIVAGELGIKTIKFENSEELKNELKKLGIEI